MSDEKHILAFSGKKQSGKNTAFNFLLGTDMCKLAVVRGTIEVRETDGKLVISDIFGGDEYAGVFDIDRNTDAMRCFKEEFLNPFIRNYSFADLLKKEVCIGLLKLKWEQCFGTDAEKDSPTHLLWENMPGVVVGEDDGSDWPVYWHKPGLTTGREVMQYVGTEVFRKMYGSVWSQGTIDRIKANGSNMSVITDCRFPNEVEAVFRKCM